MPIRTGQRTPGRPDDEPEVVADGPSIAMIEEVCRQIGDQNIELAEISDHTTFNDLLNELALVDRLDSMIDRALKRLLMARGIKSLSATSEAVPAKY
jgi:hypothetical protein